MNTLPRICRRCRKKWPQERYSYTTNNKGERVRRGVCQDCEPHVHSYRMGEGPWKADVPCQKCGKEFWKKGQYSRVTRLRYCSDRCDRLKRRKAFRKCSRCERYMSFVHFDRPPDDKKNRRVCCRQCVGKSKRDQEDGHVRPGPAAMLKMSRTLAKKQKVPHHLGIADTRKIYDGDCHLCGKAPFSLHMVEREKGYVPENLWGLCLRCKTAIRKHGLEETLMRALEIASRHFREQLTLPKYKRPQPCDHCGELPIAVKEAMAKAEADGKRREAEAKAREEAEEPVGAQRVVASLREHVL